MTDEPKPSRRGISRRDFLADMAIAGAGLAASGLPYEAAAEAAGMAGGVTLHPGKRPVRLEINHQVFEPTLEPRVTLLDALREHLALMGTKKGCDHGQCGACTVLVDGKRIKSCLTFAVSHEGRHITTVEGLADGEELHPMQQAFLECDAFQCGYCTPGQICSAVGLLLEGKPANDAAIREGMSGNICRCGAYPHIVDAIRQVRDSGADVTPRHRRSVAGQRRSPAWEDA